MPAASAAEATRVYNLMGSIVLLDLMGGVALLLWGLHMVRSGIMRAFGSELRRLLNTALRNRGLALLAGIGATAPFAHRHNSWHRAYWPIGACLVAAAAITALRKWRFENAQPDEPQA